MTHAHCGLEIASPSSDLKDIGGILAPRLR